MVAIPAGRYRLGSDEHYAEEKLVRDVEVAAFHMDRTPVTNGAFAEFVAATGYLTVAERADPPGSALFTMSAGPIDLQDPSRCWRTSGLACSRGTSRVRASPARRRPARFRRTATASST